MARPPRNRPHFHLEGGGEAEPYTSPRIVITGLPPARVRAQHAERLSHAIGAAVEQARQKLGTRDPAIAEGQNGFTLNSRSRPRSGMPSKVSKTSPPRLNSLPLGPSPAIKRWFLPLCSCLNALPSSFPKSSSYIATRTRSLESRGTKL